MLSIVGACSPVLDWRELRLDASGVVALLPCKPSVYERRLALAGVDLTLTLRACSAGGATWAVAHSKLNDPARVEPALRALSATAAGNVGAKPLDPRSWAPAGTTPNVAAVRWHAEGHLPDGRSVASHTAVFARGLYVFQATVIGADISNEAAETFFNGLRVAA